MRRATNTSPSRLMNTAPTPFRYGSSAAFRSWHAFRGYQRRDGRQHVAPTSSAGIQARSRSRVTGYGGVSAMPTIARRLCSPGRPTAGRSMGRQPVDRDVDADQWWSGGPRHPDGGADLPRWNHQQQAADPAAPSTDLRRSSSLRTSRPRRAADVAGQGAEHRLQPLAVSSLDAAARSARGPRYVNGGPPPIGTVARISCPDRRAARAHSSGRSA